jgi:hypothetical protein
MTLSGEVRPASTWIERFALPLALSVMEAQPLALGIALISLMVTSTPTDAPVGAGGIALAALGLLWWAMFVEHRLRPSTREREGTLLYLLGWLGAFVAIAAPHLPFLLAGEHIFPVLLDAALITWLWRRGMYRAQTGFEYGSLATSFKVGFGILLGILLIVMLLPEQKALRDMLANALPVFFLSGLVTLSLARLGTLRNRHHSVDGPSADPARAWLLALALFGGVLVALVIIIEAIFSFSSFEWVVSALTPLWNALGTLISWILYGIIFIVLAPIFYIITFLFDLITQHATSPQKPPIVGLKPSPIQQPWHPQPISPELLTIGRWVFLVLALFVVLVVMRAILRRWYVRSKSEGIEEVRERLDARSLLSERWQEWWNRRRRRTQASSPPEPLDPDSARARYRELLSTLAASKSELARKPAETPAEYEVRLLAQFGGTAGPQNNTNNDDLPTDTALLDELTFAYILERYGGKRTDDRIRMYLRTWVPRLVTRLADKLSAHNR